MSGLGRDNTISNAIKLLFLASAGYPALAEVEAARERSCMGCLGNVKSAGLAASWLPGSLQSGGGTCVAGWEGGRGLQSCYVGV